jgi:hypothetical protein
LNEEYKEVYLMLDEMRKLVKTDLESPAKYSESEERESDKKKVEVEEEDKVEERDEEGFNDEREEPIGVEE